MLKLKEITKIYGTKKTEQTLLALKGITTSFQRRGFVSILGPSGCGKTTLLNIIGGLDRSTKGSLIIEGKDTDDFKDAKWDSYRNNYVGFVFQNYNLIPHQSVMKNVEVALALSGIAKSERRQKAKQALISVGLEDQLNKKVNQLSGGQCQRVAIARALVNEPKIVLADEPTGALDSQTSIQIMETLKNISKKKLVIMVTHNNELAEKYSSRIINMKDGAIVSDRILDENACENNNNLVKDFSNNNELKKTHMAFSTAIGLSYGNLKTKKGRTAITAIAIGIGLFAVAFLLSVVNATKSTINKGFQAAGSSYILEIRQGAVDFSKNQQKLNEAEEKRTNFEKTHKRYPEGDVVYNCPDFSELANDDFTSAQNVFEKNKGNNITAEYVAFIKQLEKEFSKKINYINFKTDVDLPILYNVNNKIFSSIDDNSKGFSGRNIVDQINLPQEEFEKQYEYVGTDSRFPRQLNEVLLIIDRRNSINPLDAKILQSHKDEQLTTADLLGKQVGKLVSNDEFYDELRGKFVIKSDDKLLELYNDEKIGIPLKVVGVVRPSSKLDDFVAHLNSKTSGFVGLHALRDEMVKIASQSKLVIAQKAATNRDLLTGKTFDNIYEKEAVLRRRGCSDCAVSEIKIVLTNEDALKEVSKRLNEYNENKPKDEQIYFVDRNEQRRIGLRAFESAAYFGIAIFSGVSLSISCLMIGLLTFVSVLERKKEIGILRSVGARKKDISRIFKAETTLIGVFGGLIANITAFFASILVNFIATKNSGFQATICSISPLHWVVVFLIGIFITRIAGFIPSRIAAKKNPVDALKND